MNHLVFHLYSSTERNSSDKHSIQTINLYRTKREDGPRHFHIDFCMLLETRSFKEFHIVMSDQNRRDKQVRIVIVCQTCLIHLMRPMPEQFRNPSNYPRI